MKSSRINLEKFWKRNWNKYYKYKYKKVIIIYEMNNSIKKPIINVEDSKIFKY